MDDPRRSRYDFTFSLSRNSSVSRIFGLYSRLLNVLTFSLPLGSIQLKISPLLRLLAYVY